MHIWQLSENKTSILYFLGVLTSDFCLLWAGCQMPLRRGSGCHLALSDCDFFSVSLLFEKYFVFWWGFDKARACDTVSLPSYVGPCSWWRDVDFLLSLAIRLPSAITVPEPSHLKVTNHFIFYLVYDYLGVCLISKFLFIYVIWRLA